MFKIISALSLNKTIGIDNKLPWHLRADLQHFKNATLNQRIIMGRKTMEALGRPLPHRTNIVMSRSANIIPGTAPTPTDETLVEWQQCAAPTYIAGGAEIYAVFLPYCQEMSLTWVLAEVDGDTHFPLPNLKDWNLKQFRFQPSDVHNQYDHVICEYVRKSDTKVFTSINSLV